MLEFGLGLALAGIGCGHEDDGDSPSGDDSHEGSGDDSATDTAPPPSVELTVLVTLDGEPVEGALVVQPGASESWETDAGGEAQVELDTTIMGALALAASHEDARVGGDELDLEDIAELAGEPYLIELFRFDPTDNEDYTFQHPGTTELDDTTEYCNHCHITIFDDWWDSQHRQSASRTQLHDLYAGAAATYADEAGCTAAGGSWWEGIAPGSGAAGWRCYVGDGVLPALNEGCGESEPCDGVGTNGGATGACADCHAPGIEGRLGGRDLLEAVGNSYDFGVHCDVCHRVESVDLDSTDPGVSGRLHLVRPIEESPSPGLGEWSPLIFGPYPDVLNPRMGSVARDLFHQADLCSGCHQYEQPVLLPGEAADASRWPDGLLPVHTTWQEWVDGPLGDLDPDLAAPCQSCHMPPDPDVGNSADLGNEMHEGEPGISTGWYRPPGAVRRHAWFGPRSEEQRMIDLALALDVEASMDGDELVVGVETMHAGPGHAVPTGEPLRSVLLLVEATCGDTALVATGGDAVPDFGGAADSKESGEDWTVWDGASAGDVIRVVRRTGDWYDYAGTGPFGDGTFSAEEKGMPVEEVAGAAVVTAVDAGVVTLDRSLPEGDVAYRVAAAAGLPADGDAAGGWAGAPGFGFARVMAGADGRRMVPHFLAVDVASDNRLVSGSSWTTSHRFDAAGCASPEARAVLVYRAYPTELATERGWDLRERVMEEAWASP